MSGEHEVEIFFHCAPECRVETVAAGFAIQRGPATLLLELPRDARGAARLYHGSTAPLCGWHSRHYDQREPSPTIAWRARLAGPALLRTELMCHSDYRGGA
jgi:hypothetical protein